MREYGTTGTLKAPVNHLRLRRIERAVLRFRQMASLQKFGWVQASIHNHFNFVRQLVDRQNYKPRPLAAQAEWRSLSA